MSFPNRHPICSRRCDGIHDFCHHLTTPRWPSTRSAPDSSLCAYSQSASRTFPGDPLGGLSPNRSSEPRRLSSGAMDHPTSCRLESSTHHSQIFDNRNEAEPIGMKPSRREGPSGCEKNQCKSARIRAEGLVRRRNGPYVVNYYPNTDRMKTTVQYSPQVALEGVAPHPDPYPERRLERRIFIVREDTSRVDDLRALPCTSITTQRASSLDGSCNPLIIRALSHG